MSESLENSTLPKLVVIGNAMPIGLALEDIFQRAPHRYRITLFSAEPCVEYDRIMLSAMLAGEKAYRDVIIQDDDWYPRNGVKRYKGEAVVAIDRSAKTVTTTRGRVERYDKLIIVTGSTPIVVPAQGVNLAGVVTFRDLDDVDAMLRQADTGGHAVVVGGGPLGIETAVGLKAKGMSVSVVHLMPTLMECHLDASAGRLLQETIERRGVEVVTSATMQAILGEANVEGVKLDDGRVIPADMVVIAVGFRPNAHLADKAGLVVDGGVKVDDAMRTSDPDIYAVGECVEHRGRCYGPVPPLFEMAKVLAAQLCGDTTAAYHGSVTSARLNVAGIDLFSAGDVSEGVDVDQIVLRDLRHGVYKRIVLRDNAIVGVVLFGDTVDGSWFFDLLKRGADIAAMRDMLIFGQAYQGGLPLDPYGGRCSLAG